MLMYESLMGVVCLYDSMVDCNVNYVNIEDDKEIVWAYNLEIRPNYHKHGELDIICVGIWDNLA